MGARATISLNAAILRAPRTGIGQYLAELAAALVERDEMDFQYFTGWAWQSDLPGAPMPGYSRWSGVVKRCLPGAYQWRRHIQQQRFNAGLRLQPAALYHEPSLWPLAFDGPMIMTVHDLAHVHYPQTQPADRLREIERLAPGGIQRASRILVDSEFVAHELGAHYGVAQERIVVAPLGCASRFKPRSASELLQPLAGLDLRPGGYLLCIGTLEPRKNLQLALRAHALLPSAVRKSYPLVLIGMSGWRTDEFAADLERGLDSGHVRTLGYLTDEQLAQVLSGARALVFPSLYEGFGLPVLEAMASGVPVVLTRAAALPEVAGEAGTYIDALDVEDCMQAMMRLIEDQSYWRSCQALGLERAEAFSWANCAAITAAVYREAMES